MTSRHAPDRFVIALMTSCTLALGCPQDEVGDDDTGSAGDDDTTQPAAEDADGDGWTTALGDCDDNDPLVHPEADEGCNGEDNDCDGLLGDGELDLDSDGWMGCEGDCDDEDVDAHPGAPEVCDGVDNDCDGSLLEGEDDVDGDGVFVCAGDCDDEDPGAYPGAEEQCNGVDDNCNGSVPLDEEDADGDGFRACDGDCDDADASAYPGASEVCDDQPDNDCDGVFDPAEIDADLDGYTGCDGDCDDADADLSPADGDGDGWSSCDGDCLDSDATVHPGATEVCDGLDTDCDGQLSGDEDDADADGWSVCSGDCDDGDPAVHPGAVEGCNGVDDDCDGLMLDGEAEDLDADGDLACEDCDDLDASLSLDDLDGDTFSSCDGDCDDTDAAISPAAAEIAGDWVDEDCDGLAGEPPWIDLLDSPDPFGDAAGYPLDIEWFQFRYDGQELQMRLVSYTSFLDDDPDLQVDMYLADDDRWFALTWDNVYPDPDPLMLWECIDGSYTSVDVVSSMAQLDDTPTSIVLTVDPTELGFSGDVWGFAGVDRWSGYLDFAPDSGEFVPFCYELTPRLDAVTETYDDGFGGDGDGIMEAGETIHLTLDLANACLGTTDTGLTGTLSLAPVSTASVNFSVDTVTFNGGAAVGAMEDAPADDTFVFDIDPSTPDGSVLVFELVVTDTSGTTWELYTYPWVLEYPAQVAQTTVLTDADDFSDPFDLAEVSYSSYAGTLYLQIDSHDLHDADQQVGMLLDVDLDGAYEYLLTTFDVADVDYSGGLYELNSEDGYYYLVGEPSLYQFASGTDFLLFGVPLADIGYPTMLLGYAYATDVTGADIDFAPDALTGTEDHAIMPLMEAPWLMLLDAGIEEVAGDGDDLTEPGEAWALSAEVRNVGLVDAPQTLSTLQIGETWATVAVDSVDAGPIPAGSSIVTGPSWPFEIDPSAPPSALFDASFATDTGGLVFEVEWTFQSGIVGGETGALAPDVTSSGVLVGDTTSASDDYDDPSGCTGYTAEGPDLVYAIDLAAGQTLSADLVYEPGGPDAVLYVSTSAFFADSWCLEGSDDDEDETESLTYTASTTATHYVVVDGYKSGVGGEYELTLTF